MFLTGTAVLPGGVVQANSTDVQEQKAHHEFQCVGRKRHGKGPGQCLGKQAHKKHDVHAVLIHAARDHAEPKDKKREHGPHRGGVPKGLVFPDVYITSHIE